MLCDAILKSNAQILLWEHSGGGIDGFRLYDAVKGTPFVVKSEPNRNIRLLAVQPIKSGINLSDFCFTVRAYKGDTESLPSNPVCRMRPGVNGAAEAGTLRPLFARARRTPKAM